MHSVFANTFTPVTLLPDYPPHTTPTHDGWVNGTVSIDPCPPSSRTMVAISTGSRIGKRLADEVVCIGNQILPRDRGHVTQKLRIKKKRGLIIGFVS